MNCNVVIPELIFDTYIEIWFCIPLVVVSEAPVVVDVVSFAGTVVVVVLDVVIDVVILLDEEVDVSINNIGYEIIAKRWKIV